MLQDFRDKIRGVTAGILVAILIIPFAFFGVDSLFLSGSGVDQAVSVNGEKISQFQVDQGIAFRRQQIMSQFPDMDPSLLGDEQLRGPVVDALIREVLIEQAAREQRMTVSERTFRDIVVAQEAFRRDGRYDPALYEYTIGRMGFTPRAYREQVERELLVNQFMGGVFATAFTTPRELESFLALSLESRDFHYLTIPLNHFVDDIVIDDNEVEAYYQRHADEFQEPERVSVEFIRLSAEDLMDRVEVDEARIRAQFEVELQALGDTLQWRVAHIQISEGPGDAHLEVLDSIRQRLAEGEDFGDLAREFSEDGGSAQQGGELGVFTPGTLPESFETALEQLQPGEVSDPLTTDSGIHLVRLIERLETERPDYQEQRGRIRDELLVRSAQDLLPRVVEDLKDRTFQVDDLHEVANDMGLQWGVTEPFARSGGPGIASHPLVIQAAFSEEVVEHGFASEVLELQDQEFVVVKLREHHPTRRKTVDEVREGIVAALTEERAVELARDKAEALQARAREGAAIEELAVEEGLDWQVVLKGTRFEAPVDPALTRAVFAVPSGSRLPHVGQVVTAGGDVVVFSLAGVHSGDGARLSVAERENLQQSLQQMMVAREWRAYEETLMANAKIK